MLYVLTSVHITEDGHYPNTFMHTESSSRPLAVNVFTDVGLTRHFINPQGDRGSRKIINVFLNNIFPFTISNHVVCKTRHLMKEF